MGAVNDTGLGLKPKRNYVQSRFTHYVQNEWEYSVQYIRCYRQKDTSAKFPLTTQVLFLRKHSLLLAAISREER